MSIHNIIYPHSGRIIWVTLQHHSKWLVSYMYCMCHMSVRNSHNENGVCASLPSQIRSVVGLRPSSSALTPHVAPRPCSARPRRKGALHRCVFWRVWGIIVTELPTFSRVWPPWASPGRTLWNDYSHRDYKRTLEMFPQLIDGKFLSYNNCLIKRQDDE